ncbi:hypothetical protein DACRYDRAFT_53439, partial [Dacryopinax primogenitus]
IGPGGTVPMLARATIVDFRGQMLLDTYVQPTAPITNYRTYTTGITAELLYNESALPFDRVQATIGEIVRDRFIIGYTLWWDFSILGIRHPAKDTRDVGLYLPFRAALGQPNNVLGLPTLVWHFMRRRIAMRVHDSAENARAALDLYRSNAQQWEGFVVAGDWPCALPPVTYARCFT